MFHYIMNTKIYFRVLLEIIVGRSYHPTCPGPSGENDQILVVVGFLNVTHSLEIFTNRQNIQQR